MPLSTTQAQAFLNSILGSGTPSHWYVALYTSEPTPAGGGTEFVGDTYARVALTNNNTNFPGASASYPSVVSNGAAITFPTPGVNWGTIPFWGLVSTPTGGSPSWFGAFSAPLNVTTGNPVVIAIANLNLSLG